MFSALKVKIQICFSVFMAIINLIYEESLLHWSSVFSWFLLQLIAWDGGGDSALKKFNIWLFKLIIAIYTIYVRKVACCLLRYISSSLLQKSGANRGWTKAMRKTWDGTKTLLRHCIKTHQTDSYLW